MMIIQSIDRAQHILSLFSFERPVLGLQEIANELDVGKGTAHNIVKTLCAGGMLQQEADTRKYRLGTKLFALGMIVAGTMEINRNARPLIRQLVQDIGQTCRMAIWDEDAALITLEVEPGLSDTVTIQLGPRFPAYCTALGRALLAHLPVEKQTAYLDNVTMQPFTSNTIVDREKLVAELQATRDRGYAVNNQEISFGRSSIATTVFKAGGEPVAAISVATPPQILFGDQKDRLINALWDTARKISETMGYLQG